MNENKLMGTVANATRLLIIVAVIAALFGAFATMPAIADGEDGPVIDSDNETVDDQDEQHSDSDYELSELRDAGTQPSGAPDSARIHNERMYWVVYWPADQPWSTPGDEDGWEYLSAGERIGTNEVHVRNIRTETGSETQRLNVVYWTEETVEVQEGNTTVTETVPRVHAEEQVQLEFNQGWPSEPVKLQKNDEPVQVTMWYESEPDVRWQFEHRSIETTSEMEISTVGGYLTQAAVDFLLPLVLGVFITGAGVRAALKRAGTGPQWGLFAWMILLVIMTILILLFAYESTANLVGQAPIIASLFLVSLFAVVMLESYEFHVRKVLFEQHETKEWVTPSGEDGVGALEEHAEKHKVVKLDDGSQAIVKSGLLPFIARVAGSVARIENIDELKSRVEMPESSLADEKWYVDSNADELVDYQQEGWTLQTPEFSLDNASNIVLQYGLALGGIWFAATYLPGVWSFIGFGAAVAVAFARPTDGYARLNPAPAHYADAHANQIQRNMEYDELKTLDEAREQKWKLEGQNERDVEEKIDDRDSTLLEEMLERDDEDRSVLNFDDDDEDNEGDEE